MASLNPRSLTNKLNQVCRRALEGAAGLCLSRTNYNIEVEHWLLKLLEPANTDFARILRHYDVDPSRLNQELMRTLDGLKTGNARPPALSLDVLDVMRQAWLLASLEFGAGRLRSGHLLTALLTEQALGGRTRAASAQLAKIPGEQLQKELSALIGGSSEDTLEPGEAATAPGPEGRGVGSKTPALDQYTIDLTVRARKGGIDPVIGRDAEIRQVIDILTRRRQNNPILTGEAGVGKTAVVEGFALRVAADDVPPALKGISLRSLDLTLLQAGAGVKGEFEQRLESVISEVKASPQPIILFIDEAHMLIGAGGAAGQGDAANLLKPALARGELRTIAATTWMEYKKSFENDAALKRRFQVVKVEEPTDSVAISMMLGLSGVLEKHHKVRILKEAIEDAVKLSRRYLTDRQLPDKAVSLLDTAGARVALGLASTPGAVEDIERELAGLKVEMGLLASEQTTGVDHAARLGELAARKTKLEEQLGQTSKRWAEELALVKQIHEATARLTGPHPEGKAPSAEEEKKARAALEGHKQELARLQGDRPLVHPFVSSQTVADVVSSWTGIPVGRMVTNEIETVLNLAEKLKERVIGQDHALEAIARRIQTARANMVDPRRPIGVFLLAGPSGVGKTETAMALADILYGGDRNMVIINMSEYKEDHKISRLTGSAAGYVGYGEGGVLTEGVRRKPYCVVLLDELEKANVAVQEIFYQVFDKGMLQDDKGTEINFKNTIILMTSNVGTDLIAKVAADPDTRPDAAGLEEVLRPELLKAFKPAFLGRMTVVPYYPLSDEVLRRIILLQLHRIATRVRENYRASFTYDDKLIALVANRCKDAESGARNVDHILTGSLLPELSVELLTALANRQKVKAIHVGVGEDGKFSYRLEQ